MINRSFSRLPTLFSPMWVHGSRLFLLDALLFMPLYTSSRLPSQVSRLYAPTHGC